MRPGRVLASCVVVGLLGLAGCGGGEDPPAPVTAADLPDDLCAAVPDGVVHRWSLAEEDHSTSGGRDRAEATCSMSGAVDGEPVTLTITLTSYGGADADAVRSRVGDDLAARCADLEANAAGRFTGKADRCSTETPAGPERGRVTEISRSIPAHGVVEVSMRHSGRLWQLVGAEVVGLSGVVANTDPADLA